MRRRSRIVLIVIAALIAIAGFGLFYGMGYIRRMPLNEVDVSKIPDGSYQGRFGHGRWQYSVEVSVKAGKITGITTKDSDPGSFIPQVIERILQTQSVKVDKLSGATITPKAFAKAVENALAGK